MDLSPLYEPFEHADTWLSELLVGSPVLVALALAAVLGLRHASDPDHLVAVTSLVASRDRDVRSGVWVGACWGAGHGVVLVALGAPLVLTHAGAPTWLETRAETAIGCVTILLALRVLWRWLRGGYRTGPHSHGAEMHRHVHGGSGGHGHVRTVHEAVGLGMLHGLGGSGGVVVVLIAGMPNMTASVVALLVYAPMTALSMALFTGAYSWAFTRTLVQPVYRGVLVPWSAAFSLVFGLWYAGLV